MNKVSQIYKNKFNSFKIQKIKINIYNLNIPNYI